jgi:hypothetical protein
MGAIILYYIAIIVLLVEMLVMFLERLRSSSPTTIAPRHATTAAPKTVSR